MRPRAFQVAAGACCALLAALGPQLGAIEAPAWLLSTYALVIGIAMAALAVTLGLPLAQRALGKRASDGEIVVFSFGLGMGMLALAVFALGRLGWLRPPGIISLFAAAGFLGAPEVAEGLRRTSGLLRTVSSDLRGSRFARLGVGLILVLLVGMTVLLALLPPWDYDGLMYHLEAPRRFLEAGRVSALPDLVQANGPLLTQMLYTAALAVGSDSLPKLIHLGFAWALLLMTWIAGRKCLGSQGAWLSAGLLAGIPIYFLWGILAYADMARAFFTFLALWAIFRWVDDTDPRWLLGAGLATGLALGTKLVAAPLLPIAALWIVVQGWTTSRTGAVKAAAGFGLVAAAVALPWFLVSAVELGDPLYPLLGKGTAWPTDRTALHNEYVGSFGLGQGWLEFVALPWNLYANHEAFAALMQSIEYPGFLFPLALLLPWAAAGPDLRRFGFPALGLLVAWFFTSQQTRFLLPVYPLLSLMTAAVLLSLAGRVRVRLAGLLPIGLVAGLVATSAIYLFLFSWEMRSPLVVLGVESRSDFLEREVHDYPALRFLHTQLPPGSLALNLWDGMGYYCRDRCLADAGQVRWVHLHRTTGSVDGMRVALEQLGVSHLLVDRESLNFMLQHDPRGYHAAAYRFLVETFAPVCGRVVFEDEAVTVMELTCASPNPSP